MDALESMTEKLRATGLYALTGATTADFELAAYAAGLDCAAAALAQLQRESFAATASDYGLTLRERQFGLLSAGEEEQRRAAVLGFGAVTPNDFTKGGVARAFKTAGLDCEICENPAARKLYLNCPDTITDETARNRAADAAKMFLPAHLSAELDFRRISWNNIDLKDDAFDARDALGLTWDAIDGYENAVVQI